MIASSPSPGESRRDSTIMVDTTITVEIPKTPPASDANSSTPMTLRSPKKYNPTLPSSTNFQIPPLEWLAGTWSVTHSTLPMWRKAKNVRITYKLIPPKSPNGPTLIDDEVSSEPTQKSFMPQPKSIKGVDTPDGDGAWNWRGKGWLKIASSHWEVLGWGEKGGEKWVVTWFAPSLFTPAGLDIYSSRKEGLSDELYEEITKGLEGLEAKEMADLCKAEMREVKIEY